MSKSLPPQPRAPTLNQTSASVMKAFDKLREFYGSKWNRIFKSITTDNGSEFADLSNLEQVSKTLVYYNAIFLRENAWINAAYIAKIEVWYNSLPRKILNYKTPEERFDVELDHIYRRR